MQPPPAGYGPPPGGGYGAPPGGAYGPPAGYGVPPGGVPARPPPGGPPKTNKQLYIILGIVGGIVLLGGGCLVCAFVGGGLAFFGRRAPSAAGGATCERAVACCRAVVGRSGGSLSSCDSYRGMPESSCGQAVANFEDAARRLGLSCGAGVSGAGKTPSPAAVAKVGQSCQNPWDCPGMRCCWTSGGEKKCGTDCSGGIVCTQNIHCPKGFVCNGATCAPGPEGTPPSTKPPCSEACPKGFNLVDTNVGPGKGCKPCPAGYSCQKWGADPTMKDSGEYMCVCNKAGACDMGK